MKTYTLIALNLLLTQTALAASSSPVTVYGVMDLAVVSDSDSGRHLMKVDSGQQTASRIGIKGEEDLGNGMKASFVIEEQIEADTGQPSFAGTLFGSQCWVGLNTPLGAIRMGRVYTPYFGSIATNDPFDAKGPGESTRVFYDSGVRMNNTFKYSLPPTLGGFYADLAYGAGEVAGNASANRQISMDAGYAAGPLNIVLAHHDANDATGAKLARSSLVGGTYDFHVLKAWVVLARSRNDAQLDTRDTLLGVSLPLGRDTLALDYVHKADSYHHDANATQLAFGYYHPLSLRTNLYVVGSNLANQDLAQYQATLPGGTRRILSLGMRHQF